MKFRVGLIAASMAVVLSFSACSAKTAETVVDDTVAVEVTKAEEGEIKNEYTYSGKLAAVNSVNILSTVSGKVAKAYVSVGDSVQAGASLFALDTENMVIGRDSAAAALSASEANIAVSQSKVDAAQLAFDNVKTNYDNNVVLYDAGAISKSAMDQMEMSYKQAELTLSQAKIGYDASIAQRDASAAQLKTIDKNLSDSVVTSPISGVVTTMTAKEGEMLNQTAGAPAVVMDMSKMLVKVSVSERIINKINKGDEIDLKISAVSDGLIKGTVKTVSPAANYGGTYDVEVEVDNENGDIKSGMFAEVYFVNEKSEKAIVLPKEAVLTSGDEQYVYVVRDGAAFKVSVKTSIDDGKNISVISGINTGDSVITKGQNYVDDGSLVKVVNGEE